MKRKKAGIFFCMLIAIVLSMTGFSEKKKVVVEAATTTYNGIEWEYSIMSVTGGSSYAYDVKPTSEVTGSVTVPSTLGGVPVQSIAASAFSGFTGLTSITLPSTLEIISDNAFNSCTNLKTVTSLNYTSGSLHYIGNNAFNGCKSLTSISLKYATSLGNQAFENCSSLSEVTFSSELENIPLLAFGYCTSLKKVTINNQNVNLGSYAFVGCTSLQEIVLPEQVKSMTIGTNACYGCKALKTFCFPCDVELLEGAFASCYNLQNITFEGKATIGIRAFSYSSEPTDEPAELKITFMEDATIGNSSFQSNTGLTELDFKKNVIISGSESFSGCSNLKIITANGEFNVNGYYIFGDSSAVENLTFGGNVNTDAEFPNLKSVTYTGNTTQIISAPAMEFSENVSDLTGAIDISKVKEVVFRNSSVDLSKVTVTGASASKAKIYALAGSNGEAFAKNHSSGFDFSDIVVNQEDLTVTVQNKEITVKQGQSIPEITPSLLGLVVQAKYYGKENAETIEYNSSSPSKGYQLILPEFQAGENTITVKYSGQEQKITINIIQEKAVVSETPISNQTDLKDADIVLSKAIFYCAYKKTVKPSVIVKYNDINLIKDQDYKVSYTENTAYGKGKIMITGIGAYTGTIEKTFLLLPEKSKISSCKTYIWRNQKVIKLIWKKQKGVEGYQIVYAYSKEGKYKEMTKKEGSITSNVFAVPKKKVYIKIRAYVRVSGKIKYGPYSSIKKVVLK